MGFAMVGPEMSIHHLFSLRINWRVYCRTNPTISENIMILCLYIISHNCYHSIDAVRINLSKICYSLGPVVCSEEHHIFLTAHSSTDRKIVINAVNNSWSCSDNHPSYSYLNFDFTNFSIYGDHNYFDTK